MNIKLSSIAVALIATSASAFAVDPSLLRGQSEFVEHTSSASATPRTVVRAELDRAAVQGQSGTQRPEFVEFAAAPAGKTRAEVRAELEQAYAAGQLGGQAEFVEHTAVASSKSRDEVRQEAIRAAGAVRNNSYSGS